jgi:hypothetical protein
MGARRGNFEHGKHLVVFRTGFESSQRKDSTPRRKDILGFGKELIDVKAICREKASGDLHEKN